MNNLLESLSSQRLRLRVQDSDLKRLLSSVKEGRGHDTKLSDAFYDSLEGVLHDLRAVTIDNHDADAFLKPVSKIDYPDYFEIIKEPMDLQTMLKKVKQKQYKSKAEFSDDLELIWSNCFVYNTGDNHPLRMCAKRLQEKAIRLLKNVTDRRDRLDPPVPMDMRTTPALNGVNLNGHARKHSVTPMPKAPAITITKKVVSATPPPQAPRREVFFAESPAFVRTAGGMSTFLALDRDLDSENVAGPSRLLQIIDSGESDEEGHSTEAVNGVLGDKRKLIVNGDPRPRKKARTRVRADADPVELWWEATTSAALMANGLPTLTYSSSTMCESPQHSTPPAPTPAPKSIRKKKKKRPPEHPDLQQPKSLLGLISNNISALRRVRRTHSKFQTLNVSSDDGAGPSGIIEPPEPIADEADVDIDATIDERPWRSRGTGLEVGQQDADECLDWMGMKILEHSGFQGTSRAALDVFTGVAAEYLFNVGRTLRFLCDKYSQQMSAEEIILHTLFESGITHVRDLERYITDDVIRYGTRLIDLEKKLLNAYDEAATENALDDEAFFGDGDEEDGELLMGNFADQFGDDFLGLRELGIASELGLQSLTIPKKLLKGKNKQRLAQDSAKPNEPPPPYPPPPLFVPLDSPRVDAQIGLLRVFYMQRFNEHASRTAPGQATPFVKLPPRPLSLTTVLELELEGRNPAEVLQEHALMAPPVPNPAAPPVLLPDDAPPPARTRSGPLGQIIRPSAGALAAMKKAKPKEGVHGPAGLGAGMQPLSGGAPDASVGVVAPPEFSTTGRMASVSTSNAEGTQHVKKNASSKKKSDTPMFVVANA
ncbi:hypothetical protein EW145_g6557 [Phellinidium pouzarii]|uniref:Bromo domain-containing protein n=1 Tax=Phellinidium pouzarii TaxID=167371 RepID=A0A4S4L0Y7_9AGAM|nr:hypothetical protein EW145_g6557 [Phellinidium pouzarii]